MTRLVVATRNRHKVREIRAILGEQFQYLALDEELSDAPKTIEDADTFAGNATKKAVELAQRLATGSTLDLRSSAVLVLADDSGLEVDALGSAPGVHSARFAALGAGAGGLASSLTSNSADTDNNAKLLRLLEAVPWAKRTARFHCALALTPVLTTKSSASPVCYADEYELQTELFDGVCPGRITFAPRGQGGFGYDPLFIPEGYEQSFAELGEDVKNKISHRAAALARLRERLLAKDSCKNNFGI
jgi:XTP/dITP diphosphohydrolase